jgi:hypothetical protein
MGGVLFGCFLMRITMVKQCEHPKNENDITKFHFFLLAKNTSYFNALQNFKNTFNVRKKNILIHNLFESAFFVLRRENEK